MPEGTRKGGLSEAKARKCPVDTFLARGRVHRRKTAPRKGYWLSSISPFAFGHPLFGFPPEGTRKAGSGTAGVKNSPVDCFSGRGRVPPFPDASRRDVDGNGEPHPHKGICFFWFMPEGTRKGGLSEAKVRKCPVDTFVAPVCQKSRS